MKALRPTAIHALIAGAFVLVALAWGGFLAAGQINALDRGLERVEALTVDWRTVLLGPRPVPRGVVIIEIDDDTVQAAGSYPLPRDTVARIVRGLAARAPQAIALDMLFLEQRDTRADADLAAALGATRSVIGAVGSAPQAGARVPRFERIALPAGPFAVSAQPGVVNVVTDASGIVRYVPLLFQAADTILPSFVLAAAAAALDTSPVLGADVIRLAGRTVATDIGFHMPVRYYGPAGAIRHVSAASVLRNALGPDAVRGQLAVIGVTALGSGDAFATPFSRNVPGVEVMATAITNLLAGDALVRTPAIRWIDGATTVLLPVVILGLLAMTRPLTGTCLAVGLIAAWFACATAAFAAGYWLSVAVPLAALAPVAGGYGLTRLVIDRQLVKKLAGEAAALAAFHPAPMAEAIARDADFLREPVLQEVAVVFLDLSGFTGIAEALGPAWTRELLAKFHERVEAEVSARHGTVISFMGDGAMIVFGLPDPRPDDAARALAAIDGLHGALEAWARTLPPVARDRLTSRIGGHRGPAVVSRLGAREHQHITATGDTVNVTSRLLEVAKQEHAGVVISQALADAAGGGPPGFVAKTVPIRGRDQPLDVLVLHRS